jgi:opacity protein-like surface antigen
VILENIMKALCLLLLAAAAGFSQPFSFGVKGGVPLTDFVDAVRTQNFTASTNTNRYIVGVTGELRLPFGLGVEADVLYRHFGFSSIGGTSGITTTSTAKDTTSSAWEFPLLAKYRFKGKIVHPFVDGGVAWDKLSGLTQTVTKAVAGITSSTTTSTPSELNQSTTIGYVMGGGVDVKVLLIHITPEVRLTRWGAKHFLDPNGNLTSKQNQAEFLVGITF